MMSIRFRSFALAMAVLGVVGAPQPAAAHDKGVLTVRTKQVAVGDTLRARGSKLAKKLDYTLELRGALKTFPMGGVVTDTAGVFTLTAALPRDAAPGSYRLVAIAPDGDVSAETNVIVTAGAESTVGVEGAHDMANMPAMGAMPGMQHAEATAEEMQLAVQTSGVQRAVMLALIVGAAMLGAALLRSPRGGADTT